MAKIKLAPLHNKEALAFWKDKVRLSPGQFAKLDDAAKVLAFAVSGIARGAELESVFNGLQRAIKDGGTYDDFKKSLAQVWERRGWTGRRAWRVDNIFRTNIQTAYNVGRYRQMMEVADSRPYWQYDAVNDSRTRPTHRAMDGKVFRHDHPFWDTWFPPNGWRCRCGVITLSAREVKRDGLTVETDDPTGRLVEPTTPDGVKMPARLLMPDPGFDHHPGKTVWGGVVDKETAPINWTDLDNLRGPEDYRRKSLENVRPKDIGELDESMLLPGGKTDAFYLDAFTQAYGAEKVMEDAMGEPVILSRRAFLIDKTPGAPAQWKFNKAGHGESILVMDRLLKDPWEIWLLPQQNKQGQIRLAKRYVSLWRTRDKKKIGGMGVYEVAGGVFTGVTSFIPLTKKGEINLRYLDKQRRGLLLYKKGR
ncbi:MAG: hypothetical protein APR55_07090 [Methanolinea sp. SDB]|nr:MAG: hypothetical protein APR55_07090 [Methanolinea sp. SDB]